jgi:CBS domain-containing protein
MDDIFVGQLMTEPVETVSPDTPIAAAAERMLAAKVGSMVVVDADEQLLGILTATDFVQMVADGDAAGEVTVADRMSEDPVTTTAQEDIREVADRMLEHGFHHFPVVDDDEGVVGIITTTDLTAYLSTRRSPSPL